MQMIDATVAFLIGFFAFKGFRLLKDKTLLYLHFSFTLLGVGFLADGLATRYFMMRPGRLAMSLSNFGYTIFFITELIAYGLLIFTYLQQTKKMFHSIGSIFPFIIVQYGHISELIIFFFTAYIACQCAINYTVKRNANSFLVLIGFVLIAFSHALFPMIRDIGLSFLIAHTMQLFGFISLLIMLFRVSRNK
jgi:hypothetical protein